MYISIRVYNIAKTITRLYCCITVCIIASDFFDRIYKRFYIHDCHPTSAGEWQTTWLGKLIIMFNNTGIVIMNGFKEILCTLFEFILCNDYNISLFFV